MSRFVEIALYPAEWICRFVLSLFHVRLEYLPDELRILFVGFVALMFWLWLWRGIVILVQRKVFNYYSQGGQ